MHRAFNIEGDATYLVHITDHTNTYIDPEYLEDILQIYNTGDFTLHLSFTRETATSTLVTVPDRLRDYILTKELGSNIIDEYDRTGNLTDFSRRHLTKYLADYTLMFGEGKHQVAHLRSVIRAATLIFPYLKGGSDVDIECVVSI